MFYHLEFCIEISLPLITEKSGMKIRLMFKYDCEGDVNSTHISGIKLFYLSLRVPFPIRLFADLALRNQCKGILGFLLR